MLTLMPLNQSFPVHFVLLALMFWGLYFFQASVAAAEPAGAGKRVGKEVKNQTEKTKQPPTSVPASRDNHRVKRLVPTWSAFQEAVPVLAVCPMGCSFWPRSFHSSV